MFYLAAIAAAKTTFNGIVSPSEEIRGKPALSAADYVDDGTSMMNEGELM